MKQQRPRAVEGLVWMAVWALVSLVVIGFNSGSFSDDDSTLFLPFVFPGFLFPFNLGPLNLADSDAWSSVADVFFDVGVGNYALHDLVTLGLLVTSVLALLPALQSKAATLTRVAMILGAMHVVMALNVGLFDEFGYNEAGTYLGGAAVLAVGVVLAWWRLRQPTRPPVSPTVAPASAAAQFVVQTADGMTDWLTWDQLMWMRQNGQLQPTTLVYDGARQVTTPAGSLPGLFTS